MCSITMLAVGTIFNFFCQGKWNILVPYKNNREVSVTLNNAEKIDTGGPKSKQIRLSDSKKIEVLSNHKNVRDTTAEEYTRCRSWNLNSKQIAFIIKKFDAMTSEGQYLSYSFYDCEIRGEIRIDNKKYMYWLGAGATLTLRHGNTTWYYGCSGDKCKQYFISGKLSKNELEQ